MVTDSAEAQKVRRPFLMTSIQALGMLPILILLAVTFQVCSGYIETHSLSSALTGGIDLSVGSSLAASAMLGLIVSLIPAYSFLGFAACLFTGLVLGLMNGLLIALLRLPPFIVTLGSLTAVRGVARLFSNDRTVFNSDLSFAFIGNQSFYGVPWLMVIAFSVIVISWLILRHTVLGAYIYAVGGNSDAARLSGIKVPLILIFVYGISGLLGGLGGAMSAARLFAANGVQLGQSYELD